MRSHHCFKLSALAVALSMAAICVAPAHAGNACDAVYHAGIDAIQAPHHLYSTMTTTRSGKPTATEAILVAGVEYLKMDGKWQRSPISQQDMLKPAEEKIKKHPDTCTVVGDQVKDGEQATLYKAHNNEVDIDQQVWIAKSSGRLLHATVNLPDGSVVDTRYEYANVQAPAGVN